MNLKSSQSSWIWAVKDGSAIKSNSPSFNIQQHNDMDSFSLDLSKGSGGNSLNPFVSQAATTTAAGGASPTTASSSQGGSGNYGGGSGSSGSSTGGSNGSASSQGSGGSEEGESSLFQKLNRAAEAHGILMGLAFVVFMPAGAIMIRLLSFTGLVWVHAVTQVFAYLMAIAGLGLGVYIATNPPQAKQVSIPTTILLDMMAKFFCFRSPSITLSSGSLSFPCSWSSHFSALLTTKSTNHSIVEPCGRLLMSGSGG